MPSDSSEFDARNEVLKDLNSELVQTYGKGTW